MTQHCKNLVKEELLQGENSLRMSSFEVWINLSLLWRSYRVCWCKFDCITNTECGERSNCGIRSSESRRVFVCIHARHAENRINQLFCGEPRLIIINLNVCCGGCCWADRPMAHSATTAVRSSQKRNCLLHWYTREFLKLGFWFLLRVVC